MNDALKLMAQENFRLAAEVDLLSADLKYLRDVMGVMSRLLAAHEVPVPTEELAMLSKQHAERIIGISKMASAVNEIQGMVFGMRTGDESAGMRTGKVTEDDVTRILSDIDPDIVKKMGE